MNCLHISFSTIFHFSSVYSPTLTAGVVSFGIQIQCIQLQVVIKDIMMRAENIYLGRI